MLAPLAGLALAGATAPVWPWSVPPGLAAPKVPADNPMSAAKVELGRRLFYDADLSIDGTMSCATCHEQHRAFADGNRTHPGATGEAGRRNVQALANVAWFTRLTHADPSLASLEDQVAVPVFGTHPVEMGMAGREAELAARLGRDDCYRAQFRQAFPETEGRIGETAIAKALASFERTLVSFGSPHDHGRLSRAAQDGRAIFARDCAGCHAGPLFTDMAYHRLAQSGPADPGLAEKSGRAEDRGKFRTPSLRNVALTAPYWHDGSVPTLEAVLDRHGGRRYDPDEKASLLAFLDALTDREFVERKDLALPMTACGKPL